MKTYTAQIIYKIECEGVGSEQYEEQWRLIFADDENIALTEARKVGDEDAASFVDRHGRRVAWKLIAVKDLTEVHLHNGDLLVSVVKEV